ncbi:hypothetical protein E6O75_ATG00750 [Venturia nashicola]|uniref:Uncharacterized protein n=1 Tax=Venturia nashicola TaxID=86259 RepID=A0A4Z1PGB5_9PEZI|nr:hypothetical protein E6O75_ATG00750 [Venturia nashicola]
MFDVAYASIKQNLDGLKAQLTKIDDRIASNPTNRVFIDLKKQVQHAIENDENRLQLVLNSSDASQRRTTAEIGAISHSTNALHDNTNQLSRKTDSLRGINNKLHDMTIAMHSKIDILHEKAGSSLELSGAVHGRVANVNDKVAFLGIQVTEVADMLEDVSVAVVGGLGPKMDSLASQMASIEQKFSMAHISNGGMAKLQEAVGMHHLMMADTDGPIHGFAKLQDQVTEIQKSTSMLARKIDGLHDSMKQHVSYQAGTVCGQLDCIGDQLSFLRDPGNSRFEDRMALLEQKVDSLAGFEKKLDSLVGLGEKLDGLTGLHEKLDSFAGLNEKIFTIEVESSGNWGFQAGLPRSKPASIASQDRVNAWGTQSCGSFPAGQLDFSPPGSICSGSDVGSRYAQQDEDEICYHVSDDRYNADGWVLPPVNKSSGTAYGDSVETAEASNSGWGNEQHQEDKYWGTPGSTTSPSVHILEHHAIQSDGTIRDNHGKAIGQVVQGDAKEFADLEYYCDDCGNVLDQEGWTVGSVKTIMPTEKVEDAADAEGASPLPLSVLDGLAVEADTLGDAQDLGVSEGHFAFAWTK